MNAASIFSRRKISSKMRLTEVVPAPDEPVIEMIGCRVDIRTPQARNRPRLPKSGERSAIAAGSMW